MSSYILTPNSGLKVRSKTSKLRKKLSSEGGSFPAVWAKWESDYQTLNSIGGPAADTELVTRWEDSSLVGVNFLSDDTPPDPIAPVFNTNQLNGYGALTFDGVNDVMETLAFTAQPAGAAIIVARFVSTGTPQALYDGQGRNLLYAGSSSDFNAYAGGYIVATFPIDTTWRLWGMVFDGANSIFAVPGYSTTGDTVGTDPLTTLVLGAGVGTPYDTWGNIQVAAFYRWDTGMTLGQLQAASVAIAAKYGLTQL